MENAVSCDKCYKNYKNMVTFKKHLMLNRCKLKIIDLSCKICNKTFTRTQTKQTHELKCKAKLSDIVENKIHLIHNTLNDLNIITKCDISSLITPIHIIQQTMVNNTNVCGNVTNITNQIIINNFGSEDISHITDKQYLRLIGLCKGSIPKLIEDTHFNSEVPQNINVYKSNFKDKLVKVLVNNRWNIEDENVVLRELYMKKGELLEEKFEELKYLLSETLKSRFQWFLDNREEEEMMNEIIGYIKKLLYNKRDMIDRTL